MRLKRGGRWGYSLIIWQFCLFVIQGFQWAKISVTAGLSQRIINLKSPYNIFQISLPTFGIYRYPNNTRIRTYGLLLGIAKSQIWFTDFLYIKAIWPSMIPFFIFVGQQLKPAHVIVSRLILLIFFHMSMIKSSGLELWLEEGSMNLKN